MFYCGFVEFILKAMRQKRHGIGIVEYCFLCSPCGSLNHCFLILWDGT